MRSGLEFEESYTKIRSDITLMFASGDLAGYAADKPLAAAPGERWSYSTGTANILGRIVSETAGTTFAERMSFPRRALFDPLGMRSAVFEVDGRGNFVGGSLVFASARDYARFGLLYLRDGVWEGRRLLPAGWVDLARTGTHAERGGRYGAGWWIEPAPDASVGPEFRKLTSPSAGADIFTAQGFQGQLTVVVPSRDLVVVRLGLLDDRIGWPPLREWTHRLVALFPRSP
jgi:CubicO group peptidase (beta-lactamase class C family)